MIKYFAGDKVRITKAANYRIVDGPISSRGLNLMPGQTCILLVERDWPPSGVWHALHGRTTIFLHESISGSAMSSSMPDTARVCHGRVC